MEQSSGRLAVRLIRPDLTGDRERDEREMTRIGVQLGYAVTETVVVINPSIESPHTTVMTALTDTLADAVIVSDLQIVDGIDYAIRQRAQIITVEGERVLERAAAAVSTSA